MSLYWTINDRIFVCVSLYKMQLYSKPVRIVWFECISQQSIHCNVYTLLYVQFKGKSIKQEEIVDFLLTVDLTIATQNGAQAKRALTPQLASSIYT